MFFKNPEPKAISFSDLKRGEVFKCNEDSLYMTIRPIEDFKNNLYNAIDLFDGVHMHFEDYVTVYKVNGYFQIE